MYVQREQELQANSAKSSILDHHDWSIIAVNNQKFKTSPALGGLFCVHGKRVLDQDDEKKKNDVEIWNVEMRENENSDSTLYNSATVTLARPGIYTIPKQNYFEKHAVDDNNGSTTPTKDMFRLYRDEFDSHSPSHLPLRNVLNLFERSRTNFLGGPDALRKLKEEDGLLFVVTNVDDLCLFPTTKTNDNNNDDKEQQPITMTPGLMTLVQTDFEVKRKGMILECYQTLKTTDQPLAQGKITLMTLDAKAFRPTSNLPDWLWDLLGQKNY